MFINKPVLTLCKENETAFINVQTYWALTAHVGSGEMLVNDRCYELRIKHHYPEDTFAFYFIDRASHDDIELMDAEAFENRRNAIAENETQECERHREMSEDEKDAEIDRLASKRALPPSGEFAWLCDECKAASLNRADAILFDRARAMDKTEEKVLVELKRHWSALLLLINPTTNL